LSARGGARQLLVQGEVLPMSSSLVAEEKGTVECTCALLGLWVWKEK
jgi:hypothetical protein